MRIAIQSAPLGMDPHLQNESLTSAVLANVDDGLTEFDEGSRIQPCLASGWTNPDARTWVFRIRPSVRFHGGRALSAADVVFSLERARTLPGTGLASYLVEVESVRELDPLTVEIRTRRPFAPLLANLTPVDVVPRGAPSRIDEPVGPGPCRLARNGGGVVELVPASRDWRDGRPVAPLRFVVEPRPDERLRMLLAGGLDVAAHLDEIALNALRTVECCREVVRPASTVEYFRLAVVDAKFDDRRVRQAVSLSIDRARTLLGEAGLP